jgi:hypothetical protein
MPSKRNKRKHKKGGPGASKPGPSSASSATNGDALTESKLDNSTTHTDTQADRPTLQGRESLMKLRKMSRKFAKLRGVSSRALHPFLYDRGALGGIKHAGMYMHTHTLTHVYVRHSHEVRVYAQMHMHIYIYIYTYIQTHMTGLPPTPSLLLLLLLPLPPTTPS